MCETFGSPPHSETTWPSGRQDAIDRRIPIRDELLPQLEGWQKIRNQIPDADLSPVLLVGRGGRRLSDRAVYDAVARVGNKAQLGPEHGGEKLNPRTLRNSLAKNLLETGEPAANVAELANSLKKAATPHERRQTDDVEEP